MRTLIAYATKHGSSEKCARLLAKQLVGETVLCNLKKQAAGDLASFDQIIVGGSIYIGKIRSAVTKFLMKNQAILLQKKLGLFICCMAQGAEGETELKTAFPAAFSKHASAAGIFGGCFNVSDMNWFEKKIIQMVNKNSPGSEPIPDNQDLDRLDRDAIARFAADLNER